MQVIEYTAKSLDEARATAAAKFGVAPDTITIEVLEETKGLFGKVNLKVKASVAGAKEAKPEKPAAKKAPARAAKAKPAEEEVSAPAEAPKAAAEAKPKRGAAKAKAAPAEPTSDAPAADEEEGASEYSATQEDADALLSTLKDILEAGDIKALVEVTSIKGRYVNLKIDGKDVGHLVGKHGEVLNSLQYLMNVIGSKTLNIQARATIDGNDYRQRRELALTKHAEDIAQQVIDNQMEAVLDALPAFERRVVHKALSEMDGVTTYSEGEEPNRRVVISPA